jgi:hypothetical protein
MERAARNSIPGQINLPEFQHGARKDEKKLACRANSRE